MNELSPPDLVWAGLFLAGVFLYGAAYEFKAKNPRDARLLAATGALSLAGTGIAFYFRAHYLTSVIRNSPKRNSQ
jgi:hypothetical protein